MRQDKVATAYDEIRNRIEQRVRYFQRLIKDDGDDLLGTAHEAFMEACRTYRRKKGDLVRWVCFIVSRRLRDVVRKRIRRSKLLPKAKMQQWWELNVPDNSPVEVTGLSQDARKVVFLALEAVRLGAGPRTARNAAVNALRLVGWTHSRVDDALCEIREQLLGD